MCRCCAHATPCNSFLGGLQGTLSAVQLHLKLEQALLAGHANDLGCKAMAIHKQVVVRIEPLALLPKWIRRGHCQLSSNVSSWKML